MVGIMMISSLWMAFMATTCFSTAAAFSLSRHIRPNGILLANAAVCEPPTIQQKEQRIAEDPYDGMDDAFVQKQWFMPSVVERALIHQDASVDPHELLSRLDMSDADRAKAQEALECTDESSQLVQTAPGVLTPAECAKLRTFLRKTIQDDGIDNVDGCPDWQVNLSSHKLTKILGTSAVLRLMAVPEQLFGHENDANNNSNNNNSSFDYERVGIFIRMYQRSKRPWMPFHRDGNRWTLNVALNHDTEYTGGRLMALYNGGLQILDGRQEGDATCHAACVQHGVSAMHDGVRYSMILFFHSSSGEA
mmetsp:Transcript_5362/g.11358  ORF Transcript_5362/g.11358 Transcript_5362/m.11358 type:complete len:306 (-) Transcript_5362:148-1065(-)